MPRTPLPTLRGPCGTRCGLSWLTRGGRPSTAAHPRACPPPPCSAASGAGTVGAGGGAEPARPPPGRVRRLPQRLTAGPTGGCRGAGGTATSRGLPAAYGGRPCHLFDRAVTRCPHTQLLWGEGTGAGVRGSLTFCFPVQLIPGRKKESYFTCASRRYPVSGIMGRLCFLHTFLFNLQNT